MCRTQIKPTFALVPGRFLLRTAVPSAMTISTEYPDDNERLTCTYIPFRLFSRGILNKYTSVASYYKYDATLVYLCFNCFNYLYYTFSILIAVSKHFGKSE